MNGFEKLLCVLTGPTHSGTTYTQQLISSHPDIFCGFETGLLAHKNFNHGWCVPFNKWIYEGDFHWGVDKKVNFSSKTYDEKFDLLFKFKGSGDGFIQEFIKNSKWMIDKTPRYFENIDILKNVIQNTPSNVPIIITIKDFYNTYLSSIKFRIIGKEESIFLALPESRRNWQKFVFKKKLLAVNMIYNYISCLSYIKNHPQKERIHLFLHEDFARRPDEYVLRLQEILGAKLHFSENLSIKKYKEKIGSDDFAYSNWKYSSKTNNFILEDIADSFIGSVKKDYDNLILELKEKI